ncbi:MAG: endolytic transglycosylase MltG [Alphaproteobacteria bacterium]|nr:endolytic transglycosylase MltG [Alphaproteobacteria bacterium]
MGRLLAGIFTLVVVAGGVMGWGYYVFTQPGPLAEPKIITIPKGIGLTGIASLLAEEGIVEYPWLFIAGVRVADVGRGLRAGEFEVPAGISPNGVMDLLLDGKTVQHRITIVEGITVKQALEEIMAADTLDGEITEVPDEGWMLPETYYFDRGDSRQALVARMVADMNKALDELWPDRDGGIAVADRQQAVILASIVEKESAIAEERPRIAAVFNNRLKNGMRLQADPTVVYGLSNGTGAIDRPLMTKDLETPNPYNTYLIDGLPPGPIAIPSRDAIAAVLSPADTKELYFVADGTGGHVFAKTLAEHNRNVAKWRRLQRQKSQ